MPELPNVWNEPFQKELIDALRREASFRFRKHQLPETLEAWQKRRPVLRRKFLEAMKVKVDHRLPLEMCEYGDIDRGNYIIRKITFQTRPGIHTVAALYIPKGQGDGPFPPSSTCTDIGRMDTLPPISRNGATFLPSGAMWFFPRMPLARGNAPGKKGQRGNITAECSAAV